MQPRKQGLKCSAKIENVSPKLNRAGMLKVKREAVEQYHLKIARNTKYISKLIRKEGSNY